MVYRCIKPHCPPDCDQCRCAIPGDDVARVLVADLLVHIDELRDHYGIGGTAEDGEFAVIDRARHFLCGEPLPQDTATPEHQT